MLFTPLSGMEETVMFEHLEKLHRFFLKEKKKRRKVMNMVTVTHISMLSPLTQHSRMRKKKKTCLFVFVFFFLPSLAMCYKSVKRTRNACNPRPYTVHDINERSTMRFYSSRENMKKRMKEILGQAQT